MLNLDFKLVVDRIGVLRFSGRSVGAGLAEWGPPEGRRIRGWVKLEGRVGRPCLGGEALDSLVLPPGADLVITPPALEPFLPAGLAVPPCNLPRLPPEGCEWDIFLGILDLIGPGLGLWESFRKVLLGIAGGGGSLKLDSNPSGSFSGEDPE